MTKPSLPSLMTVLSNGQITRINLRDNTRSLVGARDLIREGIEYALSNHKVGILSNLTPFIDKIITPKELALLTLQRSTITYPRFEDTPLFKRLENIKHGKLTLHDML